MAQSDEIVSLNELAKEIEHHAQLSDEHTIKTAFLIRDARNRVLAGEAGNIKWEAWSKANIKLGSTRINEYLRIARAPDPIAELARLQELGRKRAKKRRKNRADQSWKKDKDRVQLIEWIKTGPLSVVRKMVRNLETLERYPKLVPTSENDTNHTKQAA